MGACSSSDPKVKSDIKKNVKPTDGGKPAEPEKPKRKFNKEDLMISKKEGEAIVKEAGSLDGAEFYIEECKDCDIFLLDHFACIFIDECERCRIFVGPTEAAVFVRTCTKCDFMIACQQFRSRDCQDCRFGLFCGTEPIIETSTNMQFGCFDFSYFTLRQQMSSAGLKLWNNKWWQIYDFNKNADRPNWSLMPESEVPTLLRLEACAGAISAEEAAMDRVVPLTLGSRPRPSQESCFVVFLPDSDSYIEEFLAAAMTAGWALARTRCAPLPEERAKQLFAWTKEPKLPAQCKGKEVTGIEVCGSGVAQAVQALLGAREGLAKATRLVPEQETASLARDFFDTWKDEV